MNLPDWAALGLIGAGVAVMVVVWAACAGAGRGDQRMGRK